MGLISWFKSWRVKKTLETMDEAKLGDFVGEYLKRTQKEHADALRTAQNLNKAALMDMQTKKLKSEMRDLLHDEDEEDDYDEDEEDDYDEDEEDDDIVGGVVKNLFKSAVSGGQPSAASVLPSSKSDLTGIIKTLTPEQKLIVKEKFNIDL